MRIFGAGVVVSVLWFWIFNIIGWVLYGDTINVNTVEVYIFTGAAFASGAISQAIKQIKGE